MDNDTTKRCSVCKQTYTDPQLHFYKNKSKKDGFSDRCKQCAAKLAKKYHYPSKLTKEQKIATGEAKRAVSAEKPKTCNKCNHTYATASEGFFANNTTKDGYLNACKICHEAKCKQWREDNADYWKPRNYANMKDWRKKNPEKVKEQSKKQRLKHPEKEKERRHRYALNHPEKARAASRRTSLRYLARKKGAEGKHTTADVELQYKSQKGLCWWCGVPVGDTYHVDHRIALADGGTDYPENICISCKPCNCAKGAKKPWQFNGRLL